MESLLGTLLLLIIILKNEKFHWNSCGGIGEGNPEFQSQGRLDFSRKILPTPFVDHWLTTPIICWEDMEQIFLFRLQSSLNLHLNSFIVYVSSLRFPFSFMDAPAQRFVRETGRRDGDTVLIERIETGVGSSGFLWHANGRNRRVFQFVFHFVRYLCASSCLVSRI